MTQGIENKYLITGRLEGRDEPDVVIVETDKGLAHAKQIFKGKLLETYRANQRYDDCDAESPEFYVESARPLAMVLESPFTADSVKAETLAELEEDEPENDEPVIPGWG